MGVPAPRVADNGPVTVTTDDLDQDHGPSAEPIEPGGRWRTPLVALVAGMCLTLGLVAGLLVVPALTRPGDDSVEAGFVRDMSTHHSQAVEMGLTAFGSPSASEKIRAIAVDIALGQHGQIGLMSAWLREWHLEPTGSRPPMAWMGEHAGQDGGPLMPGMATADEIARLRAASGRDQDVLFCQLMLRHHVGGLHMVDAVLARTDHSDVRWLAESMRSTQGKEVAMFETLLKEMGAKPI